MTVITEDAWLSELNRLFAKADDGFTTEELAEYSGHCRKWAQETVKKGIRAGVVRLAGRRTIVRIDGKEAWVPVYNVVKKNH